MIVQIQNLSMLTLTMLQMYGVCAVGSWVAIEIGRMTGGHWTIVVRFHCMVVGVAVVALVVTLVVVLAGWFVVVELGGIWMYGVSGCVC